MTVLLIDDDDALRAAIADTFAIAGIAVEPHADPRSALRRIAPDFGGVVVTDIRMPGMDGHAVFDAVHAADPEVPVLLMTGHGDIPMAVAAMERGAFDFIAKPFATDHLVASVRRALETRRLVLENRRLRAELPAAEEDFPLIGTTAAMAALRAAIRQLAQVEVDVLIEGETGTGKELVARMLHRQSRRRAREFVAIDCAALPDHLADEALFGSRLAQGRIGDADRGTLFLDEIDSMSAAAKGDLAQACAQGRFREDLLYRLETVRVRIPPLRERRADVPLLFRYFLQEAAERFGRPVPDLTAPVEARLMTDQWRGNVRALRNFAVQTVLALPVTDGEDGTLPLAEQVARFEAAVIVEALTKAAGDVTSAAQALSVSRRSLYDRLQRYGLDASEHRRPG
jgi:two-component system C4-dicarboxylate transport response regulator DctD